MTLVGMDVAGKIELASPRHKTSNALSGQELSGIYREIAVDILCPAGAFWAVQGGLAIGESENEAGCGG